MNLQKKTLARYRQFFPQDTLRETSARTGIQITRIFRLFNGKNMKVAELEAFENAVEMKLAENPSFARLTRALEDASAIMTNSELAKIADYVERRVQCKSYSRLYITTNENAIIA